MDFGDVKLLYNLCCMCGGVDVEMILFVDKVVQCMCDKGVEVMEIFDWKLYFVL